MKKFLLIAVLFFALAIPANAADITAPPAPGSAQDLMPPEQESFGEGLWFVIKSAVQTLEPDIAQAGRTCLAVVAVVLLTSLLGSFPGRTKSVTELSCAVALGSMLLRSAGSMISTAVSTIQELSTYGKLLLPVMTTAMAAQGGITTSAALYTGTAVFDSILSSLIESMLIPMVYVFIALATANSALGEDLLKKIRDFVKWLISWCLKIILYIFTGYMGITGVISGTADQAALKAAKLTISGAVPVVGGILSDASETILVSAGMVKNAVGIYGVLAVLAIAIGPFLKIGVEYLMLKLTAAVCGVFASKRTSELIQDISGAMGLLLAMTGTVCLLLLISTVCMLKGVS